MAFLKKPEIKLLEINKRIDNYFIIKNGSLMIRPEKFDEFNELIKDHPTYSLEVKGECAELYDYKVWNQYDIYSSPNESGSSKRGSLKVVKDHEGVNLKFFDLQNKELGQMGASINDESCDSSYKFIHQAYAIRGDWVNLGTGPWGTEAWIRVPYSYFFDEWSPSFKWSTHDYVGFKRIDGKTYAIYSESDETNKRGDEFKEVRVPIKDEEIMDSAGRLNIRRSCIESSYTCKVTHKDCMCLFARRLPGLLNF